jgi:hypothetical protein
VGIQHRRRTLPSEIHVIDVATGDIDVSTDVGVNRSRLLK